MNMEGNFGKGPEPVKQVPDQRSEKTKSALRKFAVGAAALFSVTVGSAKTKTENLTFSDSKKTETAVAEKNETSENDVDLSSGLENKFELDTTNAIEIKDVSLNDTVYILPVENFGSWENLYTTLTENGYQPLDAATVSRILESHKDLLPRGFSIASLGSMFTQTAVDIKANYVPGTKADIAIKDSHGQIIHSASNDPDGMYGIPVIKIKTSEVVKN